MTHPLRCAFPALGTTAEVLVAAEDPALLVAARDALVAELAAIDTACSRFRPDSELSRANDAAGRWVTVSPLLAEAIGVALRAARQTGGAVDPTIGTQLCALGYDQTFTHVTGRDSGPPPGEPARGWAAVEFDEDTRVLLVPTGARLDLGATAKALAADHAAASCAEATDHGVLVNLGGDLAIAGPPPPGGWRVGVSDDHRVPGGPGSTTVTLMGGALATSSTTVRAWRGGEHALHHIIDPATGENPAPVWRTVSVCAQTCVDANTSATAAIVLGACAPDWLSSFALPARLVAVDGAITCVAGWPVDTPRGPGDPAWIPGPAVPSLTVARGAL